MSHEEAPGRGVLRIYLGAAPGVGKTYAMLAEGWRRAERGSRVVVGLVDTHGRPNTEAQLRDLPVLARRPVPGHADLPGELDVDAVLAARPDLVLVDDLAHANPPGWPQPSRWQEVDELLAAGIDVVTTLDVDRLASLQDIVERITGVPVVESVPDAFVRSADQIELVDMSPEALRRRLAHGNVFPADRVDAALAGYFRVGTLGALRELALLWLAGRVEEQLHDYLGTHGITGVWETRERIVVAMTGAPGADRLVRRAARIAGRSQGELVGVHVRAVAAGGRPAGPELDAHRRLLGELGGHYREVVGDDVAGALAAFAAAEHATQLVIGAGPPGARDRLRRRSLVAAVLRCLDQVDVHVIADDGNVVAPRPAIDPSRWKGPMPMRWRWLAWSLCALGLPTLVLTLTQFRGSMSTGSVVLLCLALVLVVAALGGLAAGLVASLLAFFLTNWFFVPPFHQLAVASAADLVILVVFAAVASFVSLLVNRSARRSHEAQRARSEATALARTTGALMGADDPLPELVEQIRTAFALECAAVLERSGHVWDVAVSSGEPVPTRPEAGIALALDPDGDVQLVVVGGALAADDQQVLRAFAGQLSVALEARQLRAEAEAAEVLAHSNALRTALLQAVSHDLRTPLASIKASVSGLLASDVTFTEDDREILLRNIDGAADRLDRLVANLLDMSRLQAAAVDIRVREVALEDVVAAALVAIAAPADRVQVDVPDTLPLVLADAGLLERAIANLVSNALAWSPLDRPVRVQAAAVRDEVVLQVVDRGPGIPRDERDRIFEPFQRLGDRSTDAGVGLGLAVARGFVHSMGGSLDVDDTPGGGATMTIVLPLAPDPQPGP